MHKSHKIRFSDSSMYDLICTECLHTDAPGCTALNRPCSKSPSITLAFKKKMNKAYGKLGSKGRLDSEKWCNGMLQQMKLDQRITGTHRMILAVALLHSVNIEPRFVMEPKVKLLRAGRLVHVDCRHAKAACGFPEQGTLIGLLEHIRGRRAMVRVRPDWHVCVDTGVISEVS